MSSTNEMHKNVLSALALSYTHTHTLSIIIIIIITYYINYNFWTKFKMLICIYSV